MKKLITKWVIVAILILLIAYSGFATYNWLEEERIRSYTVNDVVYLSDMSLVDLGDVGLGAEYLTKPDTTDELVRESTLRYFWHARTLYYSSGMLRVLTNDDKYRLFQIAMSNLQAFFIEAYNGPNRKEILTTNLATLKQMDDTLGEILRINNLTLADAEKLLALSGNLTIG